jgi:hypothetical protein
VSARETLEKVLQTVPEERLPEVIRFAEFLSWQDERDSWRRFGQAQIAKAYGPDEPEYSLDDVKETRP